MKSKEVLQLLKCTRATLSKYVKEEKIKVTQLPNGYYDYDTNDVYKMFNGDIQTDICVYIKNNKDKLQHIKKYCIENNLKINYIYIDNDEKKEFYNLLDKIFKYSIKTIIIYKNTFDIETYKLFKYICNKFNVSIMEVQ